MMKLLMMMYVCMLYAALTASPLFLDWISSGGRCHLFAFSLQHHYHHHHHHQQYSNCHLSKQNHRQHHHRFCTALSEKGNSDDSIPPKKKPTKSTKVYHAISSHYHHHLIIITSNHYHCFITTIIFIASSSRPFSSLHYRNHFSSSTSLSFKVDRIIDDFIGKKFGAGEKFYGKRTSGLSEDEYNDLIYQGKTVSAQGDKMAEYDRVPMKSNAM